MSITVTIFTASSTCVSDALYKNLYFLCSKKVTKTKLTGKVQSTSGCECVSLLDFVSTHCIECAPCVEDGFVHSAAPSEDEPPAVAKAPVQQKTKEAAPKKAPAAKKAAAPRKKAAGTHPLETYT